MMKIDLIWSDLEKDKSISRGLLLRRYSTSSMQDVYIALQQPECLRCVAFRIKSDDKINTSGYRNLKDIRIYTIPDDRDNTRSFLLIVLANNEHREVFATLAEDLISQVANIQEGILIKEILNRFEMWKALFDKAALEGLGPEEQQGLFGELYFLRKYITNSTDFLKPVQSWLGTEKELRDYQADGWAIEVKTTYGNNHQKVHISSERQLDTTNLNTLILFHISLESQQYHGETLNQIINSIISLLSQDLVALAKFRTKLLQGGYFIHHASRYDITGYHIRRESFYTVRDNFPRIEEADIREGTGDVKYSIMLTGQSEYLVPEIFVFETIK